VQLGNLHKVKNQRLAIAMLAHVDPLLLARTRLFFIGEGADRPALTALARELGLTEHVKFLGYRQDVSRLLPGANLAIMTSLREGMPLALLEAMSAGVPVLSTPWPGARDLLLDGEAGAFAPDWEPQTFARCVETIAGDPERSRAIAKAAQAIARRDYDIGVIAQRHRELYERLSARRAA
jgi:glycosyltransferase EpsD